MNGDDQELERTQRRLDQAAELEREVLAEARKESGPEDLATVAMAFGVKGETRAPRSWLWVGAFLSAAAAILLWIRSVDETLDRGPEDVILDTATLEITFPVDGTANYGTIEWSYPRVHGTTFEVEVVAGGDTLLGKTVTGRTVLDLDVQDVSTWPNSIEIRVRALDDQGQKLDEASSRVSRSP